MLHAALVLALTAATFAALAWRGRLRLLAEEFPSRPRAAAGLLLLAAILALVVWYPAVVPGTAADVDPAGVWFPSLFAGQAVLAIFLQAWWMLAWPLPLARFLRLEGATARDVAFGLAAGAAGWALAIASAAVVAGLLVLAGWEVAGSGGGDAFGVPPLMAWLAELPLGHKLVIVAVAMTVEEAFYRAFLQPRIGLLASSVFFALSHAGYGMPTLLASVFAISLVLGHAFRRAGNLLPCIVAHGVFNAVQLLVVMPLAIEEMRRLAPA